jgi:hypothetical protein
LRCRERAFAPTIVAALNFIARRQHAMIMITIPPPAKRLLVRLIPVAVLGIGVAAIRYQPAEVFPAAAILSHADDPQFWNYWQLVLGTYQGEGIVGASRVDYVQ